MEFAGDPLLNMPLDDAVGGSGDDRFDVPIVGQRRRDMERATSLGPHDGASAGDNLAVGELGDDAAAVTERFEAITDDEFRGGGGGPSLQAINFTRGAAALSCTSYTPRSTCGRSGSLRPAPPSACDSSRNPVSPSTPEKKYVIT